MRYQRMPIEVESPEEMGYATIQYNLAESSVRDIAFGDLGIDLSELVLAYSEHRGNLALRQKIAVDGLTGQLAHENAQLSADDVLNCPSAATALFIISTTLLSPADHLVVIRPNYSTNLETPRAIGCQMSIIDLSFEYGYDLDLAELESHIKPNTRLISITNPHNPTGKVYSTAVLRQLTQLAEKYGCYLLVDETYRDLNFQSSLRPYAAAFSPNVISVCSFSKAFGAPGIRIGWLVCRDAGLMHHFLAAKEQIIITNSVVDEAIGLHLFQQKEKRLTATHAHIRANFAIFKQWFAQQPHLEWVEPTAGVVCFPRIKVEFPVNTALFYKILYEQLGTIVGPGHWFEQPDTYMRIGFGFPLLPELEGGLERLSTALSLSL